MRHLNIMAGGVHIAGEADSTTGTLRIRAGGGELVVPLGPHHLDELRRWLGVNVPASTMNEPGA